MMADDDEDDRLLIKEAFEDCRFEGQLQSVCNGLDLLSRLETTLAERGDLPDLILLDLNMPQMDGYEALKKLKENPEFSHIPVVVVTTSDAEEDVKRTYGLGVNAFMTKPKKYEALVEAIRSLKEYWLQAATLP